MAQRDSPSQDPVVREMFDTLYGPSGGTQAPVGPGFFALNPASVSTALKIYSATVDYGLQDSVAAPGADQSGKLQTAVNAIAGIGALFIPYTPNGFLIRAGAHTGTGVADPSVGVYLPSNSVLMGVGQGSYLYSDAPAGGASRIGFSFFQNTGWATSAAFSNVQVTGLRMRRTTALDGGEGPYDGCLTFRNGTKLLVEECIFESCMTGVHFEGCADYEAARCKGFSQGDVGFRVSAYSTNAWPERALLEDCWTFNSGFALDGVTLVPTPQGPLGDGIICTQNSLQIRGGGAVNPSKNAFESGQGNGANVFGITIDGFRRIADINGRGATILLADCQRVAIRDTLAECHNGGTAVIYLNASAGTQSYVEIDGDNYFDDYYATANANHIAISIGVGNSQVVIRNCTAVGGTFDCGSGGGANRNDIIWENCEARLASRNGFHITGTTARIRLRNCRAFDCGNDTTQAADNNRAGFFFDGPGGVTVENCISLETRSGGARTQTYGFGTNGTGLTINWVNNYTDGNNLNGAYSTTGTVTLAAPDEVALVGGQVLRAFNLVGDTNDRMQIDSGGGLLWGPGNAAVDTRLERSSPGLLGLVNPARSAGIIVDVTNQIIRPFVSGQSIQMGNGSTDTFAFAAFLKFGGYSAGQSATAPALATGGTIATAALGCSRVAPTAAVTGVILAAGTVAGQVVTVVNESAFSITFAASGTSNVADGVSDIIAATTARRFVWDSVTALWYRAA